jgi:hypothetical protein
MNSVQFTAAQIAAVLSRTKRNVLDRLRGVKARGMTWRGQEAKGYAVADLPEDMRAVLNELRDRFKYLSVEQLLETGLPDLCPKPNFNTLANSEISYASALMRSMDRALQLRSNLVGRALEEIGIEDYAREFGRGITPRHWRRLFLQVIQRDAGAAKFDRLELYIRDTPLLKPLEVGAITAFPMEIIQGSLRAVAQPSLLTSNESADVWHCAFLQVEELERNGLNSRSAKRQVLDFIGRLGIALTKTAKAQDKAWKRNYRRWQEGGCTSLAFKDGRKDNPGRTPLAVMTEAERHAVQKLVLNIDTNCSGKVTTSMALRMYAASPECREDLREIILKERSSKHTLTTTLKRQARVTPEAKMLHRGERNFNINAYVQPRSLTYIDEMGGLQKIQPGMLFESDDMHLNQPFYVPWEDKNDPCAAKFGVRAFRAQLMPTLDVGSGRFISYGMVLRLSDAYRAKDINWCMLNVYRAVGAPMFQRFERGIWEANDVRRLEACAKIIRAYKPGHKFIENRFGYLQKALSAKGLVDLGRDRGEFEKANKYWSAVRDGRMHPEQAGFKSLPEMTAIVVNAMTFVNAEPMEGEIYQGIPDSIWQNYISQHPLRQLTADQLIPLLPEHVMCGVAEHKATYYFNAPEFAKLGASYKVTAAFDPANPQDGAYILNREEGARATMKPGGKPYKMGELLCWAEFVERAPQFSLSDDVTDQESFERRQKYTQQCRHMYQSIMPFNRGAAHRTVEVNDGRGFVERVDIDPSGAVKRLKLGEDRQQENRDLKSLRNKERAQGIINSKPVRNPKRQIEALSDWEKAQALLKQEEGQGV